MAKSESEKSGARNKARHDVSARAAELEPGDRCLVRKVGPQQKTKIDDKWEPYIVRVTAKKPDIPVYTVQREDGQGPVRTLHRNLLLPIGEIDDDDFGNTTQRKKAPLFLHKKETTKQVAEEREGGSEQPEDESFEVRVLCRPRPPLDVSAPEFIPAARRVGARHREDPMGNPVDRAQQDIEQERDEGATALMGPKEGEVNQTMGRSDSDDASPSLVSEGDVEDQVLDDSENDVIESGNVQAAENSDTGEAELTGSGAERNPSVSDSHSRAAQDNLAQAPRRSNRQRRPVERQLGSSMSERAQRYKCYMCTYKTVDMEHVIPQTHKSKYMDALIGIMDEVSHVLNDRIEEGDWSV